MGLPDQIGGVVVAGLLGGPDGVSNSARPSMQISSTSIGRSA